MTDAVTADFIPILSTVAAPARSFIVSLHDVTPRTQAATARILEELKQLGVRVTSLLVVPDHHHEGKATENQDFVAWLRDLEAAGHEVVVHGYFHQRPRGAGESIHAKFLTRFYTQDEGEFFDLDYDEALTRITRARDEFRAARLSPIGFVAPAWLLGSEAERAARDAGMQYTTRLGAIVDLLTGESQRARSLVYSTRSHWRQQVSLVWNAALARGAEIREVMRLSIHPCDLEAPPIWRQIRELTSKIARARNVTTYRDWLEERRINRTRQ